MGWRPSAWEIGWRADLPATVLRMRLFRAVYSTNCERVALALAHKGLSVESVWIDFADRSPVEAVSGQGLVPVLDDDGTIVTDSAVILAHLEERHPDPRLFPAARARRAELDAFVDWFDLIWKRWPNAIADALDGADPDEATITAAARAMAGALDRFADLLDGRPYLFGDGLSAADCIAYPFLKYALRRDERDDETFHVVLDEYQTLEQRHAPLATWIERVGALPQL
jgi:glutathione S-transferase